MSRGSAALVGYAAIGCSVTALAACLLLIPILNTKMNTWKMDMHKQLVEFKEITDNSWREMMHVRSIVSKTAAASTSRNKRQDIATVVDLLYNQQKEAGTSFLNLAKDSPLWSPLSRRSVGYPQPQTGPGPASQDFGYLNALQQTAVSLPQQCDCSAYSPTDCPAGPPGRPGDTGKDGLTGASGAPGEPGLAAPNVDISDLPEPPCVVCPAGQPGPPGEVGPQGRPGPMGAFGHHGIPGRPGADGIMGAKGDLGPQGEMGQVGPVGYPGLDVLGGKGKPGAKGAPGAVGAPGPQGPTGKSIQFPGVQGQQGPRGPPGNPGRPGSNGRTGPQGEQGAPGRDSGYCTCPDKTQPIYEAAASPVQQYQFDGQGGGPPPATAPQDNYPSQQSQQAPQQYPSSQQAAPQQYPAAQAAPQPAYPSNQQAQPQPTPNYNQRIIRRQGAAVFPEFPTFPDADRRTDGFTGDFAEFSGGPADVEFLNFPPEFPQSRFTVRNPQPPSPVFPKSGQNMFSVDGQPLHPDQWPAFPAPRNVQGETPARLEFVNRRP